MRYGNILMEQDGVSLSKIVEYEERKIQTIQRIRRAMYRVTVDKNFTIEDLHKPKRIRLSFSPVLFADMQWEHKLKGSKMPIYLLLDDVKYWNGIPYMVSFRMSPSKPPRKTTPFIKMAVNQKRNGYFMVVRYYINRKEEKKTDFNCMFDSFFLNLPFRWVGRNKKPFDDEMGTCIRKMHFAVTIDKEAKKIIFFNRDIMHKVSI